MCNSVWLKDVIERVVFTFAEAFLAIYLVSGNSDLETAAISGAAAVLALVKGMLAKKVGDSESAAMAKTDSTLDV